MELSVTRCNVDLERGTVIITDYDVAEVVSEIGAETLLREIEYDEIIRYMTEVEEEKRELAELAREDR